MGESKRYLIAKSKEEYASILDTCKSRADFLIKMNLGRGAKAYEFVERVIEFCNYDRSKLFYSPKYINCPVCDTEFIRNQGKQKFCSIKCSNVFNASNRINRDDYQDVLNNIRIGTIKSLIRRGFKYDSNGDRVKCETDKVNKSLNCLLCNAEFNSFYRGKSKFCSKGCAESNRVKSFLNTMKGKGYTTIAKRSRAEIYLAELISKHFDSVEYNACIFNGWDADIIIHDIKCAISYNGAFHYKKLFPNQKLEQTQNRDKIKDKEIKSFGYSHYIVKDMKNFSSRFVHNEYNKFMSEVALYDSMSFP